ncbi:MAG: hypothetical protein AAGE94_09670, partial [Acidobacteriota bacterium]
ELDDRRVALRDAESRAASHLAKVDAHDARIRELESDLTEACSVGDQERERAARASADLEAAVAANTTFEADLAAASEGRRSAEADLEACAKARTMLEADLEAAASTRRTLEANAESSAATLARLQADLDACAADRSRLEADLAARTSSEGGTGDAAEAGGSAALGLMSGASAVAAAVAEPAEPDDLKKVEGIGPKIEGLLQQDGIWTWAALADAPIERLQRILDEAGPRYRIHDPATWPQQATLAARGDWEALEELQDRLLGGRAT